MWTDRASDRAKGDVLMTRPPGAFVFQSGAVRRGGRSHLLPERISEDEVETAGHGSARHRAAGRGGRHR
ncbi:hypothetical protein [Streptomyces sp. NPDC059166]|uniref:hypothetical protein n=1 Tax=Streptomyces sp. NPDC059166 TaxID=3346752 RepID=UPI0036A7A140